MTSPADTVLVHRAGLLVGTIAGEIDPSQRKLYLPYAADVTEGDIVTFRGLVRRVVTEPERWGSDGWEAGTVAEYEPGPLHLPDLGSLALPGSGQVLDENTGALTVSAGTTVWSGPCRVESAIGDGSSPELGDQLVGTMPLVITVPLAVTDVEPGYLFTVTQSRDQLLVTRVLAVKAFRVSSSSLTRELVAVDVQD